MTGAHEAVLACVELIRITLHGNDIQDVDTRWDQVLLSTSEVSNDKILESLKKMRKRESAKLTTVLAMCEQELLKISLEAEQPEVEDHGKEIY